MELFLELIDTRKELQLWSGRFSLQPGQVPATLDQVVAGVLDTMGIDLAGGPPESVAVDIEAWTLYLQGRESARRRLAGIAEAISTART